MINEAYDYKYTDQDVRETQELRHHVNTFLHEYGGDFEFLVKAKMAYMAGVPLTTATYRGVLNCMRFDLNWARRLSPPRGLITSRPNPLRVVELQRPARVILKAQFKKPYIMSTYPTAQVVHLLDIKRSQLWWYPHIEEYHAVLYPYCGRIIGRGLEQMLEANEVPECRRLCKTCERRLYEEVAGE